MKIALTTFVVTFSGLLIGLTASAQVAEMKSAFDRLSQDEGKSLAEAFSNQVKDFDELCKPPAPTAANNCHDLILVGLRKALASSPKILGPKIALVLNGADPKAAHTKYLRQMWQEFCSADPDNFQAALSHMGPKQQEHALKALAWGEDKESHAALEQCRESLAKAKIAREANMATFTRVEAKSPTGK